MRAAAEGRPDGAAWREAIAAIAVADDDSGARKLRIRGWDLVSDSGPAFGGGGLGPSSPEMLCGVIATCLAHTYEIAAARLDVPIDRVEVRVTGQNNDAALLGLESSDPDRPWGLTATVSLLAEGVPEADVAALHAFVAANCPLTKLVRSPNDLAILFG
jgi:uncharacterized OsmC-like protein